MRKDKGEWTVEGERVCDRRMKGNRGEEREMKMSRRLVISKAKERLSSRALQCLEFMNDSGKGHVTATFRDRAFKTY